MVEAKDKPFPGGAFKVRIQQILSGTILFCVLALSFPSRSEWMFGGQFKDSYLYQTKSGKYDKYINIDSKLDYSSRFTWKLEVGAVASKQETYSEGMFYVKDFRVQKAWDYWRIDFGVLDVNLNHIERVSLLSKNQSILVQGTQNILRLGSPGFGVKYFGDSAKLEFLWIADKSKQKFLFKKNSIWFPESKITNLSFGGTVLVLPEDPVFSVLEDREMGGASLGNFSLKLVKNFDSYDLGMYFFEGSSSPSYFYQFTALATNADGSEIEVDKEIGILPTYYREQSFVFFGSKQFEESILRWEIGSTKSISDFSVISYDGKVDENIYQLQWEKNQFFGSASLLHYLILTHTESDSDISYKLSPSNLIYLLQWSGESDWTFSVALSESLKFKDSRSIQLSCDYQISDRSVANLQWVDFHSEKEDIVSMYNKKQYVQAEWKYLF